MVPPSAHRYSSTHRWAALACVVAFALVLPFAMVGANHSQTASGKTIVFDHKTGNEWWVEVILGGASAASVTKVESMDTGGPWVQLAKQSGGWYAKSFHIEPGNRVMFRATWADASSITSCWFTHPAGLEQCSSTSPPTTTPTTTPPTTTPTSGVFDATFTNVKGNAWWEEAKVTVTGGSLSGVDVRVNAGTWKALSLRSWGSWAGSYNAPEGSIVQFRARSTVATEDLSGCYRWVSATPASCPGGPPPAATWPREGSFAKYEAEYGTSVPGYSDRTEVTVTLTFTGGRWEARCQGTYEEIRDDVVQVSRTIDVRAGFPAPRVFPMSGATRTYGVADCERTDVIDFTPDQVTTGTFATKKNGQAVNAPVQRAQYDDGCCSYTHADWHAATGLILEFGRAGLHSGSYGKLLDTDAPIAPADPAPIPPSGATWPTAGSFVKYRATFDSPSAKTYENTTYTYANGRWTQVSVQHFVPKPGVPFGGTESTDTYTTQDVVLPRGPLSGVAAGVVTETAIGGYHWWTDVNTARYTQTLSTTRNGAADTTPVWWSDERPGGIGDDDAWWHTGTGLTIAWEYDSFDNPSEGFYVGRLVDTNAPI